MIDPRIDKLADVLVNYCTAVQPEDKILIQGGTVAEPLIKAVYIKALQAGGFPLVQALLPDLDAIRYRYASDVQLQHIPEPTRLMMETYDANIVIMSSENTKSLSGVNPAKVALRQQAQADLFKRVMARMGKGEFRWVGTLFPTQAYAQDAEMSLNDYEEFVYGACVPDLDDPVGYWQRFAAWQQSIVDWFQGKERVHVTAPDTDLHFSIVGRSFINSAGRENMPDGEVFTSPVEDSMTGQVRFSYPVIYGGRELTGVRLWFDQGRVVKASADKNEAFLQQMLDTDDGARYVGEFAIGTNEGINRFSRMMLFDEKMSGSFHLALGMGFAETGGKNTSSIHWDMVCDLRSGGEIRVDDELIYRNGDFVLDV